MANFYTVKKVINGKEYTAQFNGISAMLRAKDSTYIEGTAITSTEKFTQYLLDNVIVEPKGLKIDDYDNLDELNEVVDFAAAVSRGEFRNTTSDAGAAEKKGRK